MAEKNALFLAPLMHTYDELCGAVSRQEWLKVERDGALCVWRGQNLSLRIDLATSVAEALQRLESHFYHLLVVDARNLPHGDANRDLQHGVLFELLERLRE